MYFILDCWFSSEYKLISSMQFCFSAKLSILVWVSDFLVFLSPTLHQINAYISINRLSSNTFLISMHYMARYSIGIQTQSYRENNLLFIKVFYKMVFQILQFLSYSLSFYLCGDSLQLQAFRHFKICRYRNFRQIQLSNCRYRQVVYELFSISTVSGNISKLY